jgi:AcrR family transcriptional regulator
VKKGSSKAKGLKRAPARATRAKRPVLISGQTPTGDRIVRSATHLFATLGFENTSMPAIAKRSGITPGAIYRHFESKAELLIAVVRYALETLPTSVRVLEPAKIDASELPEFAASYASPGHKLIRQLGLEIHAAGSREQNVMKLLAKVNEEAAQATCRSIAAAQKSGLFDATLNPDFTARLFLVMIMGLSHMDTLEPQLIGDSAWHDFVLERIAALLGFRPAAAEQSHLDRNHASANCGEPE